MFASLAPFCTWLAATPLSHFIQLTGWIIPTLQTIHILSIAAVFSSAVLVDLRLWRLFDRDVPVKDVAQRFFPLIWPVLLVLLTSGALLIIGEPRRSLLNTTFYIKMGLLACAIVLTAGLQYSLKINPQFWDNHRFAGFCVATLSLAIWGAIIFAGRWIAYTEVG
jgi:hypothetical protein